MKYTIFKETEPGKFTPTGDVLDCGDVPDSEGVAMVLQRIVDLTIQDDVAYSGALVTDTAVAPTIETPPAPAPVETPAAPTIETPAAPVPAPVETPAAA